MTAAVLLVALVLDAVLGEPRWLWDRYPHPAILMGRAIDWCERRFNTGGMRRAKGAGVMLGLGLAGLMVGWVIHLVPDGGLLEVVVAAVLIAQRSLVDHVRAVADALRLSLGDGRRMVARIVGRDTRQMQPDDVARAAIESAAENLSDGVVAPAFWFLVGGLPGLILYKITNTADSMIGHRTARFEQFGWAAARFDDLLNLVPARLTAILIALTHGRLDAVRPIMRDAPLHRSPNAGWPEAAMAAVLNIALSGPRSYGGQQSAFPFVYPEGQRDIGPGEIDASVQVLWRVWAGLIGLCLAGIWLA